MMVFCEVKLKRARDLTDRDVIKYRGQWREVLAVYRDREEIEAERGPIGEQFWTKAEADQALEAFDRVMDTYVIVRIWLHEKSAGEAEDQHVTLFRHDLVEVQSLPVWPDPPERRSGTEREPSDHMPPRCGRACPLAGTWGAGGPMPPGHVWQWENPQHTTGYLAHTREPGERR